LAHLRGLADGNVLVGDGHHGGLVVLGEGVPRSRTHPSLSSLMHPSFSTWTLLLICTRLCHLCIFQTMIHHSVCDLYEVFVEYQFTMFFVIIFLMYFTKWAMIGRMRFLDSLVVLHDRVVIVGSSLVRCGLLIEVVRHSLNK